jgi:hypothetical protein
MASAAPNRTSFQVPTKPPVAPPGLPNLTQGYSGQDRPDQVVDNVLEQEEPYRTTKFATLLWRFEHKIFPPENQRDTGGNGNSPRSILQPRLPMSEVVGQSKAP